MEYSLTFLAVGHGYSCLLVLILILMEYSLTLEAEGMYNLDNLS